MMRPDIVVLSEPNIDRGLSLPDSVELLRVQDFFAKSAVEAFGKAILLGFAGCDVMPFNLPVLLPFEHGV